MGRSATDAAAKLGSIISSPKTKRGAASKREINKTPLYILAVIALIIVAAVVFLICYETNPLTLEKSESPIVISEYMNVNDSWYINDGTASPWIELYNSSENEVNLSGYKLVHHKKKYKFKNTVLEGGKYLLVFMGSGRGATGLEIDGTAEDAFYLVDSEKKLVDLVEKTKVIDPNLSVTRTVRDGKAKEKVSKTPTPGFPNSEKGYKKFCASRRAENDLGVVISEVLSSNDNAYVDEFGSNVDFIELFNPSDKKIDLGGYAISDKESNVLNYIFPKHTTLKSGEYLLLNCSADYLAEDGSVPSGSGNMLYVPFSISNSDEGVFISNKKAFIIEEIPYLNLDKDSSLSYLAKGVYSQSYNISPGYPNTNEGVTEYKNSLKAEELSGKTVFISEAMSRNTAYAPLNEKYYDWIEIHNPTGNEVDLEGWFLSDSLKKLKKFALPSVKIAANGYALVYCSDKELNGVVNTGFDLNGGCAAYLSDKDGKLIDRVTLSELRANVSKGREGLNSEWKYFEKPTPAAENGKGKSSIATAPVANKSSGKYDNVDSLKIKFYGGGTIYYTTDGSVPNKNSTKYSGSLEIKKTTVIRAISVQKDAAASPVATYSYIVNEGHTMDVISVVSDPEGLFSNSTGIYQKGGHASSAFPYFGANFWQKWKRPATLQLLSDNEAGFSIDGETSIFGGYSRAYDKKSIKFKFRDIYGHGKLKYHLYENRDFDEYDSLVLRAGGQDVYKAIMRDDLTTTLADPILDVMASRPVVVYINGKYWGIYYLREKINAEFVASHYGVSASSVDMIQGGSTLNSGSRADWVELMDFVKSHNLADAENYKYVTDRVDVQNYADYIISEIWCGNTDAGNIRCFKSSEADNKWRWIMYDTDLGFQLGQKGIAFRMLNPAGNGANNMFSTALINGLLKNKDFRNLFVKRLEYLMKNIWSTERVLSMIDKFSDAIKDEIPRNTERWEASREWATQVEYLRQFTKARQALLKNEFATDSNLRKLIALTDEELNRCFE